MLDVLTLKRVLLAALLFALVRTVISHSAHLGAGEWLIVVLVAIALLKGMLPGPRPRSVA
jgi:hypothetical protein